VDDELEVHGVRALLVRRGGRGRRRWRVCMRGRSSMAVPTAATAAASVISAPRIHQGYCGEKVDVALGLDTGEVVRVV
jgi:hypothetical protein